MDDLSPYLNLTETREMGQLLCLKNNKPFIESGLGPESFYVLVDTEPADIDLCNEHLVFDLIRKWESLDRYPHPQSYWEFGKRFMFFSGMTLFFDAESLAETIAKAFDWKFFICGPTFLQLQRKRVRAGVSPGLRFRIFRRDAYRCQICGNSAANGYTLELDHKIPVAKGGSNDELNLWTLCFDCNRGKSDESLEL